jgi:hypothetical protein
LSRPKPRSGGRRPAFTRASAPTTIATAVNGGVTRLTQVSQVALDVVLSARRPPRFNVLILAITPLRSRCSSERPAATRQGKSGRCEAVGRSRRAPRPTRYRVTWDTWVSLGVTTVTSLPNQAERHSSWPPTPNSEEPFLKKGDLRLRPPTVTPFLSVLITFLICVHLCSSVFICVHLCSSVFICVHLCSSVFICVHLCSSVFICLHPAFTLPSPCLHSAFTVPSLYLHSVFLAYFQPPPLPTSP